MSDDGGASGAPVLGPRWAIVGIFLLLLVAGLAYARDFLMPVVLAILLKLVFSPVQRAGERVGVGPGASATLITGGLIVALLAGALALAGPVTEWVDRAPSIGRELQERLGDLRGATAEMIEAAEQVDQLAGGEADPDVQRVVVEDRGSGLAAVAMTLPHVVAQLLFTLVLVFFLMASGDMFYEKIVHALPTFRDKVRAIRIAHDIERKLSRYLFTITAINAGLGVAVGLVLWALGMPNPLLFGVMAFLLNYIPYVGALLGVAATLVVGIVSLDTLGLALAAAGSFLALTSIEGQIVTPYFVGRSLRLNTVVVFLSVTLFAWLWSVVGMLVATPLLVVIRTFCEHIPTLEPVGDFLSARGAERPPAEDAETAGT